MKKNFYLISITALALLASCNTRVISEAENDENKAAVTLDSLYKYYKAENSFMLQETFPFDLSHEATYLATEEQKDKPNPYSYLWPYSGTFSAANALLESSQDDKYKKLLDEKVLPGLEEYFDTTRSPYAYSSYIKNAPPSDRFYDDNIWLGIDFADLYKITGEERYLEKAKLIWRFILSGTDDKLDGGIYWVEQKKESKHACSNAPGAVLALKLFETTADSAYLHQGINWYEWTKKYLQDENDHLIYDNIKISGEVSKVKYSYNSGQIIQAAALLYKATADKKYLNDAQTIAKSSYDYFFENFQSAKGDNFKVLKKGDVWFIAVMMRGYIELFHQDGNPEYLKAFKENLDYAWSNMRDGNGLFNTEWKGEVKDDKKWLLTQAAMVEMYARISQIEFEK